MKDIFQVLREKELDIIRLQREIAALRVVTPILAEETDRLENGPATPPQFVATGTTGRA
jgi:hypothetical protein